MEVVTQENLVIGAKVVRGPDWKFGNQGQDSVYGVLIEDYVDEEDWARVSWLNEFGKEVANNTYRIGGSDDGSFGLGHDLYYLDSLITSDSLLSRLDQLEEKLTKKQKTAK